jgi:thymidylate synthase
MSSDYIVAGHINKIQYVALMLMVAHHCNMIPGNFVHFVQNLHIYTRHKQQAEVMLERYSKNNPILVLNTEGKSFYDITLDDFSMLDYEPVQPNFKFELGI